MSGELQALVVAGVELADLPDPARAREALQEVGFVVSLELRPSEVTEHADVVLPVAAVAEKPGAFLNWEGRVRFFEAALKPDQMTRRVAPADARVLQMLADAMLNACNLAFVTFSRMHGNLDGQIIAFFTMVVAAAEVVVGLAIIVSLFRSRHPASVDDASLMKL